MHLLRMTTRRWLILIALAAVTLVVGMQGSRWYALSKRYQRTARVAAYGERLFRLCCMGQEHEWHEVAHGVREGETGYQPREERLRLRWMNARLGVEYFVRVRAKYERAQSHPWENVVPDPPVPSAAIDALREWGYPPEGEPEPFSKWFQSPGTLGDP